MAAKFSSHATGKSGEDVVEISTMDVDDDCENVENETSISENESTAGNLKKPTTIMTTTLPACQRPQAKRTSSILQLHLEADYYDDLSNVFVSTLVVP